MAKVTDVKKAETKIATPKVVAKKTVTKKKVSFVSIKFKKFDWIDFFDTLASLLVSIGVIFIAAKTEFSVLAIVTIILSFLATVYRAYLFVKSTWTITFPKKKVKTITKVIAKDTKEKKV